ncbi:MAG: indole-3-glycerol phosphate synthase TrpC [Fimbriimonas sp.]
MSRLAEIFRNKREEVAQAKVAVPLADLEGMARDAAPTRGFRRALQGHPDLALIAEVKKASPSAGLIRSDLDPVEVAKTYERAGAQCLSVLTDQKFFQGDPENLRRIRAAVELPLLRKDFVDDPYQVVEARAWGADAILLIVASLDRNQIEDLSGLATLWGMDVLVEVHNQAELDVALSLNCPMIGVNNRDLSTFETSLKVSEALIPQIPAGTVKVSESALATRADLDRMKDAGADSVLIGTTFCAAPDIAAKMREVLGR